jgi:hypothetical protein
LSTRQQDLIKSNSEADNLKEEPFGIGECMKSEANTSFGNFRCASVALLQVGSRLSLQGRRS